MGNDAATITTARDLEKFVCGALATFRDQRFPSPRMKLGVNLSRESGDFNSDCRAPALGQTFGDVFICEIKFWKGRDDVYIGLRRYKGGVVKSVGVV